MRRAAPSIRHGGLCRRAGKAPRPARAGDQPAGPQPQSEPAGGAIRRTGTPRVGRTRTSRTIRSEGNALRAKRFFRSPRSPPGERIVGNRRCPSVVSTDRNIKARPGGSLREVRNRQFGALAALLFEFQEGRCAGRALSRRRPGRHRVMTGEVQMTCSRRFAGGGIQGGKMRPIAVSPAAQHLFPDVTTAASRDWTSCRLLVGFSRRPRRGRDRRCFLRQSGAPWRSPTCARPSSMRATSCS